MGYRGVPYRLCSHAKDRLGERSVANAELRAVLDVPDAEYPSRKHPGRRVLRKKMSASRHVSAVVIPPSRDVPEVRVVTVWVD